jgi:hypothetical protein
LPTADRLRREHEAAPVVTQMLEQYKGLVAVRETQVKALEQAEIERKSAQAESAKALEAARKDAAEARAAKDAWYRSPWLWIGVGSVLGGFVVYEVRK